MSWKELLKKNFHRWETLSAYLELDEKDQLHILKHSHFPLNLPLRLAEKIKKKTLNDPILKQFLPTQAEQQFSTGYAEDPVQDYLFKKSPKLLHKYPGRVLIVCTSACAMNCRFCFRQNFPYETERKDFHEECKFIKEDETIHEVILSGGDPLSLSDRLLNSLLQELNQIPHLKRIRFHSRFPIGIPERIDDNFLSLFNKIEKQIWFAIHINHPKELGQDLFQRLKLLQKLGITILSQTVLLKNINDDLHTLKELFEKLVDEGILPYYLHQMDRVKGAAHFEVSEEEGKALIKALTSQLSGYAIPKYVKEVPGESSKSLIYAGCTAASSE